jgi:hypothetical protein
MNGDYVGGGGKVAADLRYYRWEMGAPHTTRAELTYKIQKVSHTLADHLVPT